MVGIFYYWDSANNAVATFEVGLYAMLGNMLAVDCNLVAWLHAFLAVC